MTKGEYRVGITFNPSNDDTVGKIKRAAADLIDLIDAIPFPMFAPDEDVDGTWINEIGRLKALAQTDIETAAMHAVKAATKPAPGGNK